MGNNTLEFEGAKSVPVKGKSKGKQTTGIFAASATGQFLPMQLIYAGKTKPCHPQGVEFTSGFDVSHSLNHCSNEELVVQHIREIILPYMDKTKEEFGLPKEFGLQKSLLIYDVFKEQTRKRYTDFLLENNLIHVHVPVNLTHKSQPLDINVNGVAKGL